MAYNIAPSKQALLVSGTNIKTINSNSLLGSGNLTISGLPSAVAGDLDKVVSVDASGVSSWQYAGLGDGNLGTNNVVVGRAKPASLSGTANTIVGVSAGNALTTGTDNVFIGTSAGASGTTTVNNVSIGSGSGSTINGNSICIGYNANSSGQGVSIGSGSHASNYGIAINYAANAGNYSIALGHSASVSVTNSIGIGYNMSCSGNYQVVIGDASRGGSGANNVIVGAGSGKSGSSGTNNTILGQGTATALTTGSSNIFLGYLSGKYSTTQSNELFIDNQDRTDYAGQQTKSLIYGVFNATPASQTLTINAATTSTYGIAVSTAGYGLAIKSGSNAKIGTTGAFPGGGANKVTVSTTAVTANSIILVSPVSFTGGLTSAPYITAISAGSTFDITVSDNSFTGTVRWMIVEATP